MRLQNKAADHLLPKKIKSRKQDDQYYPVVQERYDLGIELRRPYEQRWMLCLAFIAGKQYVLFNSTAHILQQVYRLLLLPR